MFWNVLWSFCRGLCRMVNWNALSLVYKIYYSVTWVFHWNVTPQPHLFGICFCLAEFCDGSETSQPNLSDKIVFVLLQFLSPKFQMSVWVEDSDLLCHWKWRLLCLVVCWIAINICAVLICRTQQSKKSILILLDCWTLKVEAAHWNIIKYLPFIEA